MIEDYLDISLEVIYRKLNDEQILKQIQLIFFKKLYNYLFNKATSSIILEYNEFETIFAYPTDLSINNRNITFKKSVRELFLKGEDKLENIIKNKKKIKSYPKFYDFNDFLDEQLFSVYLKYFNNKLGLFSLRYTLNEIGKNVLRETYVKFKNLSFDFIANIKI